MKISLLVFLLFSIASFSSAENIPDEIEGGPCSYIEIPGTAKIVAIKEADPDAYNCKNAVVVLFNFTPDDPSAVDRYRIHYMPDTNIELKASAGINPSRKMVEKKNIKVGQIYRSVRCEITKGTCTPLSFYIPELDFSDIINDCW